jgi:hypothetical protein
MDIWAHIQHLVLYNLWYAFVTISGAQFINALEIRQK